MSGFEITYEKGDLYNGLLQSMGKAATKAKEDSRYVLEIQLFQQSETQDPHVQARRIYGLFLFYKRGTVIRDEVMNWDTTMHRRKAAPKMDAMGNVIGKDERSPAELDGFVPGQATRSQPFATGKKILSGTDSSCALCTQKVDKAKKGQRNVACGMFLDHEFLTGDTAYCPRCQRTGKIGVHAADAISWSTASFGNLAERIWQLVGVIGYDVGVDIRLQRFLGDLYAPTEQLKGGDISPKLAAELRAAAHRRESVTYLWSDLRKVMDRGGDPVAELEGFLKA